MANGFAYLVLFSWPLVVFVLFRALPRPQALAWSIIGGYLALPFAVGINPPVLPTLDKNLIPAISAAFFCLMGGADDMSDPLPANSFRRRPAPLSSRAKSAETASAPGPATSGPATSGPALSGAPEPARFARPRKAGKPQTAAEKLPFPWLFGTLVGMLFFAQLLTYLGNQTPYFVGGRVMAGLGLYDACSMLMNTGVMLLPFWLGQRHLGGARRHAVLLRIFCLAGLIYSLPTLFEIRMSPQLARWTYGFLAQNFLQAMRDGGFRPVVFLQHGLWLAIFFTMAILATFALWRHERVMGRPGYVMLAGLWLTAVLVMSNSLGALVILIGLAVVVLALSVRGQLLVALIVALTMLTYPMLRGAGWIPVERLTEAAASVSAERAQSLDFRFDNEDRLLAHANERPLSGWGGYGRSRVFDPVTGADISVTDGMWVITMGVTGWLGYISTYGLLSAPILMLYLRRKRLNIGLSTAGLCLVLGANMIDMIVNATLTPLTWLVAGALAGRCRYVAEPEEGGVTSAAQGQSLRPKGSRRATARGAAAQGAAASGPARLGRPLLRVILLSAFVGALALPGPAQAQQTAPSDTTLADPTRLAGEGLSDPTLALGLSGVADFSTAMPFLDLMKLSRPWIGHSKDDWSAMTYDQMKAGGYLDAQGWPLRIPPGLTGVGTVWDWAASKSDPDLARTRKGIYVLTYEGRGKLRIKGDAKILRDRPGEIVLQNNKGGSMTLDILETDPADHIRAIRLVAQPFKPLLEAGEIFHPVWLSLVQEARQLRFMTWMKTNDLTEPLDWDDRPHPEDVTWATRSGVPVEIMVQLANQAGAEPWFTLPAGASDDYVRQFALYVRDHLKPDLTVHVEFANEAWNGSLGSFHVLQDASLAAWGEKAPYDYHAKRATEVAVIWAEVFAAERGRLNNVLSGQTANPDVAARALRAAKWQEKEPEAFVDPASVFDSLAVATYFGNATMGHAPKRAELLERVKADPQAAAAWLAERLMDPAYDNSIPYVLDQLRANRAVAESHGLLLIAYEGGQHVLQSHGLSKIAKEDLQILTNFLSRFVRSPEMARLYRDLWAGWAQIGQGPFMQYGEVAGASKFGAWGLFTSLLDSNARGASVLELNATQASWFGDGGGARYQQGIIRLADAQGGPITGSARDDFLIGSIGADVFTPGQGRDVVRGGEGEDLLVLSGLAGDYLATREGLDIVLKGAGSDLRLRDIETVEFADGSRLELAGLVPN